MAYTLHDKLVIAVSSRAIFDFEVENAAFDPKDDRSYIELQLSRIDQPAKPGVAFRLVQKLLRLNEQSERKVEVVLLSRNDPVSGLRVFKTFEASGLAVERGIFTRGRPPFEYLAALGAHLFLSANQDDVRAALKAGFPSALLRPIDLQRLDRDPDEIRVAFDGDGVLFSDEAEIVFAEFGLGGFQAHETSRKLEPLPAGPLAPLMDALHKLKAMQRPDSPVRVRLGLFTARSAPSHERAIRTLMHRGIYLDEAAFLGGCDKGPFLQVFDPDFFFDDQAGHIASAEAVTAAGHVPYGVRNQADDPSAAATTASTQRGTISVAEP